MDALKVCADINLDTRMGAGVCVCVGGKMCLALKQITFFILYPSVVALV